jgi:hypothetical protein
MNNASESEKELKLAMVRENDELQFELQVMSLVARLESVNDYDGAKLVKRLHSKLSHTRYWYGARHERLRHWAHAELNEQQCSRFFSIVANGTADVYEPPTFEQQFNQMKWRMEKAEAELAALKATGVGRVTGIKRVRVE